MRPPTDGHDVEALDALQRALAIDPLHERAVRSLMRRHAAMGRSSEALAQYERLREELRTTYGTDPDPETQRVYRDLLTGSIEVEEPPAQPRHNLVPALTSFVGREREIADVHRCWSEAAWSRSPGSAVPARRGWPRRPLAVCSTRTPTGSGSPTWYRWLIRVSSPTRSPPRSGWTPRQARTRCAH